MMKTLINKQNPQIRITAPEIEEHFFNGFYYIETGYDFLTFWKKDWTLVEEEPEKQTSEYFKKPDYDKQVVEKMSKELAKIITDQIVEPVDLEKAADAFALKKYPSFTAENYDLVMAIRKAYANGFKAGAEWQKQRDKEWMEAKEKEFKDTRNNGFDAFMDGFNKGYELSRNEKTNETTDK